MPTCMTTMRLRFVETLITKNKMEHNRRLLLYLASSLCLCLPQVICAQDILRANYLFYHKQAPDKEYIFEPDMMLDYDGTTSVFYSQTLYLKDSLQTIAFGDQGNTTNRQAEVELRKLGGKEYPDIFLLNHINQDITVWFTRNFVFIEGIIDHLQPTWKLIQESKQIDGYTCKKAESEFCGRVWTVWYTDEIPANAGPWLLNGLSGLIVDATDSDNLFHFQLRDLSFADKSRYQFLSNYYQTLKNNPRHRRFYKEPLFQASRTYARARQSVSYFNQLAGMDLSIGGYGFDANGQRRELPTEHPYIPLISEVD